MYASFFPSSSWIKLFQSFGNQGNQVAAQQENSQEEEYGADQNGGYDDEEEDVASQFVEMDVDEEGEGDILQEDIVENFAQEEHHGHGQDAQNALGEYSEGRLDRMYNVLWEISVFPLIYCHVLQILVIWNWGSTQTCIRGMSWTRTTWYQLNKLNRTLLEVVNRKNKMRKSKSFLLVAIISMWLISVVVEFQFHSLPQLRYIMETDQVSIKIKFSEIDHKPCEPFWMDQWRFLISRVQLQWCQHRSRSMQWLLNFTTPAMDFRIIPVK